MNKVILLSAKACHGKDSFADMITYLLVEKGYKVSKTHFAKYIKGIAIDYYGAKTLDGSYNTIVKTDEMRNKLQQLGTEIIRQKMKMPLFHVSRICEDIAIVEDDFDYIIVSDARFWNEIDFVKAYFPKRVVDVRLVRLGYQCTMTEEQQNHPSEIDLDDYNFTSIISYEEGLNNLQLEAESFVSNMLRC